MTKHTAIKVLALSLPTVLLLMALELLVRVVFGVPVMAWRDWRTLNADRAFFSVNIYDPVLGWVLRPHMQVEGLGTYELGLRRNTKTTEEKIEQGAILVVGDSFAAGSEVDDPSTWPSFLERELGTRVLNAGVGGYGLDQAVLQAERLSPVANPKTVIINFTAPTTIQRTGYSSFGAPKPYFVRTGDRFVLMNNPVPTSDDRLAQGSSLRQLMSRFLTLHLFLQNLAADWWMSEVGQIFTRIRNNPIAVSCYVLTRLQEKLAPLGIRGVAVVQHGGQTYARNELRSYQADEVTKCAREQGYEVVDEYDSLNAIARRSIDELKLHYVMHEANVYGHMSAKGNELVAMLLADRLKQPAPAAQVHVMTTRSVAEHPKGDGLNRLAGIELASYQPAKARLTSASQTGPLKGEPVLRLSATSDASEHYASLAWSSDKPGRYVLSVYVRERPDVTIRLQLIDGGGNGVIGDYNLDSTGFDLQKVGRVSALDGNVESVGAGWWRLALTANLLETTGVVIMQLTKPYGVTDFAGGSTELLLQAPMVERGVSPSPFCRPDRCPAAAAPN
jgi:hypothetical protein